MTSNICFKDEYKHSFTKWTRLKLFIIKSYIMISICMELSIRLYGHSSFFCVCVSSPQFAMHRQVATSSNSLLLLHSRPTSPFFPFHLIQSVTFVKIWTQMNIRIYCTKKFTRTIIRIYLYQKIWHKRIFKYEYSSSFFTPTHSRTNVRIYSYKKIWHEQIKRKEDNLAP